MTKTMNVKLATIIYNAFSIEGGYIERGEYTITADDLTNANESLSQNIDILINDIPKKYLPDALKRTPAPAPVPEPLPKTRADAASVFSNRSLINVLKYVLAKQNRNFSLSRICDGRNRLTHYTLVVF